MSIICRIFIVFVLSLKKVEKKVGMAMALMECPDCGREISDNAQTCPNCGLNLVWKEKIGRIDEELDYKLHNYIDNLQPPQMVTKLGEIYRYRNNGLAKNLISVMGFGGAFVSFVICYFGMDMRYGVNGYHFIILCAGACLLCLPLYFYIHEKKLLKKEQERIQYEIDHFDSIKEAAIENYKQALVLQRENLIRDIIDPQSVEKVTNEPHCPICGSTNIKKISNISKAASVAFIGIYAIGKVSKQWHCSQCDSDF